MRSSLVLPALLVSLTLGVDRPRVRARADGNHPPVFRDGRGGVWMAWPQRSAGPVAEVGPGAGRHVRGGLVHRLARRHPRSVRGSEVAPRRRAGWHLRQGSAAEPRGWADPNLPLRRAGLPVGPGTRPGVGPPVVIRFVGFAPMTYIQRAAGGVQPGRRGDRPCRVLSAITEPRRRRGLLGLQARPAERVLRCAHGDEPMTQGRRCWQVKTSPAWDSAYISSGRVRRHAVGLCPKTARPGGGHAESRRRRRLLMAARLGSRPGPVAIRRR